MISTELKAQYQSRTKQIQFELHTVRGSTYRSESNPGHERLNSIIGIKIEECYGGMLSLVEAIYGRNSTQYMHLGDIRQRSLGPINKPSFGPDFERLRDALVGFNSNLMNEIEFNFIPNLYRTAAGSTFGDFLSASRSALDDGMKDVASVLASAV